MKKILIGAVIIMATAYSCRDKDSEPNPNINDLLGTWVSVDSTIKSNPNGGFYFIRDTFRFSLDPFTNHIGETSSSTVFRKGYRQAYYTFKYFSHDSLHLTYFGPLFINNSTRHKITYNPDKDTILVSNFFELYPTSIFDKFYKTQK